MAEIQDVLIIGSSGHAKVIIDIFEQRGDHRIIGLIDDQREIGAVTMGYDVIGKVDQMPQLIERHPACRIFVAIGDNWARRSVVLKVSGLVPHVPFASAIHPDAVVARSANMGAGVAVMAGAVINSMTTVSDFSIVNTRAGVDHDCWLGEYSSLAPGVTLGGHVSVGTCTAIGIGATLKNAITIGDHAVIGAGALVVKDCAGLVVMYGVPAKFIRQRSVGERYL
jgi:sugar O-acyltransferase (sialic acid O-acetyltransferase NeuD family)